MVKKRNFVSDIKRFRSLMDRIVDFGSTGVGSIPTGTTLQEIVSYFDFLFINSNKTRYWVFIIFCNST
jgi:hypothetical protein